MRNRLGAPVLYAASLLLASPALASDASAPSPQGRTADQASHAAVAAGTTPGRDSPPANRPVVPASFDKTHYAGSFRLNINSSDMSRGLLYLPTKGHEHVKKVDVLDMADSRISYGSFTPRYGMRTVTFGSFKVGPRYRLVIKTEFKDGDTRSLSAVLVNKPRPGTCSKLHVEELSGAIFLKWENTLVPEEIRRVRVSVGDWRVDVPVEKSSVEVTRGLRYGGNELRLTVTDRFGDVILDETLDVGWYPGDGRAH